MAEYMVVVSENVSEAGTLIIEAESLQLTNGGDVVLLDGVGAPLVMIAAGDWFYVEREDASVEEIEYDYDEEEDFDLDETVEETEPSENNA
jgi:hypothetical protein